MEAQTEEAASRPGENGELREEQRNGTGGQDLRGVDGSLYSHARHMLESLLNKSMRIRMTDGRTLIGLFLCTDRDCNVILGSAQEYLKPTVVRYRLLSCGDQNGAGCSECGLKHGPVERHQLSQADI
ncbi:N-alpha-acetyltransferase 38, NatC auxiliary subunit isoform X2 [Heptranchias perlo]|uniref:N-alpha-acetyltransferase 38, NatC auxiliary subunit isoform X2 n=1 Tax=Heptranchias perlo TaxID=212740 RepID=UPI0035597025